ncbi:MAG: glycosyltransferase family 9 protein, partial [Opitutales bacterium]
MLLLLQLLGRICAALPEPVVRAGCVCLGQIIGLSLRDRRHEILLSLEHAFPDETEARRRKLYYESCARTVEMALFLAASAYFKQERLNKVLEIDEATKDMMERWATRSLANKTPAVILLPHVTMAEAMILLPRSISKKVKVNVIFRPLNQVNINRWVHQLRSRYGAKMLSKRDGFNQAMAALRAGETVTVLFDQGAAKKGSLITFMDRICSATDLPGLLAKRFDADLLIAIPERTGLWRAKLHLQQLPKPDTVEEVSLASHLALEKYLKMDFNKGADWLWLHNRWDHQYKPHKRFKLSPKRSYLDIQNRYLGRDEVPRKTKLWIRMPNWLGDVVMTLPLLRALRKGRPDMELTLIGKPAFKPLFNRLGVSDGFIPLPEPGRGYFRKFYRLRTKYPDTYLLFTNSVRGDLEALLTGCRQRLGMQRPGKHRLLLTSPFKLPEDIDETKVHQTHVWELMLRGYGLEAELDYKALPKTECTGGKPQVGLICGTENAPEKRWPVSRWRQLVELLLAEQPEAEVLLFGTPADNAITTQVADAFPISSVINLSGKTNLEQFCDGLKNCAVIACNDTGGMHL